MEWVSSTFSESSANFLILDLVVASVMGTWSSIHGMVAEISLGVCMVI